MAVVFITSSPTGPLDGSRPVQGLDEWNDFPGRLKKYWKEGARCLMITAFPQNIAASEEMTAFFARTMREAGFTWTCFDLLDDRNSSMSREALQSYDVIWLGGGHVPTQNAFFQRAGLKDKLQGYEGLIIGISAGSMNMAQWVYCVPEEAGEAVDPTYQRWIPGLDLSWRRILPHYQMVKDKVLDGMRLYPDIVLPDSRGTEFVNLTDGSYIIREADGTETLYGEAYLSKDGAFYQICEKDRYIVL